MEFGANEKDYRALLAKVGIERFRERLSELIVCEFCFCFLSDHLLKN